MGNGVILNDEYPILNIEVKPLGNIEYRMANVEY
jgi:hypothetical protein